MGRVVDKRGYEPDTAIPPGDTLKETIDALGMDQTELALRMGRPLKTINEIIHAKTAITPQTAMELERVLGAPARFWMRLELDYQGTLARIQEREEIVHDLPLLSRFPYGEMAKLGWVRAVRNLEDRVAELRSFFGVATLARVPLVAEAAFRKSQKRQASPEALSAWLRKGELEAQRIETGPYSRDGFTAALREVRGLTLERPSEASVRLRELCAENGVAVVYVPHLQGTYANGASRWLGNKALIQLSLRHRYEDIFWFTFFHECGHILKHGKKAEFIDMDGDVRSAQEQEADAFAQNTLIPPGAYRLFCLAGNFSLSSVTRFSRHLSVSPAIVVGRLQHDKLLPPSHLNGLRKQLVWTPGRLSVPKG